MDPIEALLRLLHIPGLGSVRIKRLIDTYGSPEAAYHAEPPELDHHAGWKQRRSSSLWERDLAAAMQQDIELVPCFSKLYPSRLLDIPDPPILLYVRGKLLPVDCQSIAIIGTRYATPYGMEMAERFGKALAGNGTTVVSGLARGIDTAAHRAALTTGRTIAVIGSGLGNIYPPENRELAEQIASRGAVISEFPMATPPDKQTFPRRNRIVSGMTRGTLLIEAPEKSGAMITMDLARKQGRSCWALPGRIDMPSFEGNHNLVREGRAKLTTKPGEILEGFGDLFDFPSKNPSSSILMSAEEERVYASLPADGAGLDELCRTTKLPVAKISVLLMSLVLKNLVKEHPGQRYKKR